MSENAGRGRKMPFLDRHHLNKGPGEDNSNKSKRIARLFYISFALDFGGHGIDWP